MLNDFLFVCYAVLNKQSLFGFYFLNTCELNETDVLSKGTIEKKNKKKSVACYVLRVCFCLLHCILKDDVVSKWTVAKRYM